MKSRHDSDSNLDMYNNYYADLKENLLIFNKQCNRFCETPFSLFNVLDGQFQYTISHDGEWNTSQWPREKSICSHTISYGKTLIINDVTTDEEVSEMEAPEGKSIKFYAGVPLKNSEGNYFATLCVMGEHSKAFKAESRLQLEFAGHQLQSLLYYYDENKIYKNKVKKLQNKEVFLREIHHRVKNNLADICGMLQMKIGSATNPEVQDALYNAERRIIAAIKLHEVLYETEYSSYVSIKKYLAKLFEKIQEVSADDSTSVSIVAEIEDIKIDFNQCLPLGLIINELITNSYQHAFKGIRSGVINVKVRKLPEDIIQVRLSDNGSKRNSKQVEPGFGLKLIQLLAQQLKASCRFSQEEGSAFEMRFKAQPTLKPSIKKNKNMNKKNMPSEENQMA